MKKWMWQVIVAIIFDTCGIVSLILSITTDINDDVFLPVALLCICAANILLFVKNTRRNKTAKNDHFKGTDK